MQRPVLGITSRIDLFIGSRCSDFNLLPSNSVTQTHNTISVFCVQHFVRLHYLNTIKGSRYNKVFSRQQHHLHCSVYKGFKGNGISLQMKIVRLCVCMYKIIISNEVGSFICWGKIINDKRKQNVVEIRPITCINI